MTASFVSHHPDKIFDISTNTASKSSRDLEIQDLCGQLMHDHMRLDDERDALIDEMRALQRQVKRRDSLLPEGFLDLDLYDERVRIMTLSRAITEHEYRIHQLERIELRIVKMFAKEARAQKWMPLIKEEAEEDDPVPDELKTCSSTILNRREEEASSDRALGIEAGNKENVKVGKKSTFGGSKNRRRPGNHAVPGPSHQR